MAFLENQTASNLQSVIDQIEAFAVTNAGFTALTPLDIGATTTISILLKDGMYYYFYGSYYTEGTFGDFSRIRARMMKVEPTLANYLQITGVDGQRYRTNTSLWGNLDGPYTGLNLYTDGDAVHVAIEVDSNVFAHMSFGKVIQSGVWTGGEYLSGNNIREYNGSFEFFNSFNNSYLFDAGYSLANDSNSGNSYIYRILPSGAFNTYEDYPTIASLFNTTVSTQRALSTAISQPSTTSSLTNRLTTFLFETSPNNFNLRSMLIPIHLMVTDETDLTRVHLQGYIPSIKYVNIQELDAKDIVDTNWIVYPYTTKFGDSSIYPLSGNYGIAYKRV